MNIELAIQDAGTALVNVQGRLDAAAAPGFKQQIASAIADGNVRLALHLAHVSFMDSTGLGALVAALKAARRANGDISIVAPSSQVQKLFRLTAMDRVFRIFETHDEALRQLRPGSQ
ncbi:MAG TPA: STAS domain-containing protein [Microvirga sp.]|jgi:anti-sigma B factor antagonist|nr:STAS domain-containing protein [Microvirga sp.]